MSKQLTILVISIFVCTSSIAQSLIKPLSIGDTLPDLEINSIVNNPYSSFKFSQIKDKLIIIDFWATWCSPCVASIPKLDSLRTRFKGKATILPVTNEDSTKVTRFLLNMKKVKKIVFPSVTNDKRLSRLFQHTYLPHYVWLDENRKIIAITDEKYVTEQNITAFLNGHSIKFARKEDIIQLPVAAEVLKPIIQVIKNNQIEPKSIPDSNLAIYSTLTKYIEGLTSAASFFDSTRISVQNFSILSLYQIALLGNSLQILNKNTIFTEINDPVLFKQITSKTIEGKEVQPGKEALDWIRFNSYCYELKVPSALSRQRFSIMLDELNRYYGAILGIEGVIESRKSKYLSLELKDSPIDLKSVGGKLEINKDKFSLVIKNAPMEALVLNLAVPLQLYPPIIDETKYKEPIDVEIHCQLSDLTLLNKELAKYGLILKEKVKDMEIAIIRVKHPTLAKY